jgi:hypothetical protein
MEIHRKKRVVEGLRVLGIWMAIADLIVFVYGPIARLIGWELADWWVYLLVGLLVAVAFDAMAIMTLEV